VAALGTEAQPKVSAPSQVQETGQSIQAPKVNSLPLNIMFRAVTVAHQIMTEVNGAVLQETKIAATTKNCFKSYQGIWPLEFISPSKS
jgi:hypothetical protein